MADYVLQMTGPDGKSVALGDSDVHCTSDILQMTAIFFEDGTYLVDNSKLDLGVLFLVGENGLRIFEHLTAQPSSSGDSIFLNQVTVLSKKWTAIYVSRPVPWEVPTATLTKIACAFTIKDNQS